MRCGQLRPVSNQRYDGVVPSRAQPPGRLRFIPLLFGIVALWPPAMAADTDAGPEPLAGGSARLTTDQQEWLAQHNGNLRLGITEIPPQVLRKGGAYEGLSIDYIRLIEKKIGCRFELVPYATWNDVIRAAKARQIDVIFAAQQTPERLGYLAFTRPYIELPNVILVRKEHGENLTLSSMKGWSVAVSAGSAVHEYLKRDHADLRLVPVEDELVGLRKLSVGETDAMVVELSRASYYIESQGILNLRVAGDAGLLYRLSFAVRSDWPLLLDILDQGLDATSEREHQEIRRRWVIVGDGGIWSNKSFRMVVLVGLPAAAMTLLLLFVWTRMLRRLVRQRTSQLRRELAERKKAEDEVRLAHEKLRELNQELEQRVLDRTAQLQAANNELEAFAYSVSHDLRAPVRHINGFTELLKARTDASLDEDGRHYLTTILESSKRMGRLIDDLLSFSRMGRHDMRKVSVDMRMLVDEAVRDLSMETANRAIEWHIGDLPVVFADPAMLKIVLVNLLTNAIKFTQTRDKARIEVGCRPAEAEIVFFVRDNGVGFDPQYSGKLFQVFQRLHGADEFEGTGVGLANVRRIVERHGGQTWAEGQIDRGATFFFSLAQRG
jgi:signal transduction histidine kinase